MDRRARARQGRREVPAVTGDSSAETLARRVNGLVGRYTALSAQRKTQVDQRIDQLVNEVKPQGTPGQRGPGGFGPPAADAPAA